LKAVDVKQVVKLIQSVHSCSCQRSTESLRKADRLSDISLNYCARARRSEPLP